MVEEEGLEVQKVSKYNSGIAQIMRIDELWKDAHKHSRGGKLINWNWDLDSVWRELGGDLKIGDKRLEEYEEYFQKMSDLRNKLCKEEINIFIYNELLYRILQNKELWLRRLQNDLNKGTAFMDTDEDFFD